ncbi:MAG: hypothetical protein LBC20_11715 [Planctomycetaceae bacterium]|jgi:hypothetical protein|nr:hypothetical protein [Planctomycetaceae bacterium]
MKWFFLVTVFILITDILFSVSVNAQQSPPVVVGTNWKIGTQWAVQAQNLQTQNATPPQQQQAPIVWIFTVQGQTKIQDRDCYQVQIRCREAAEQQPQITIYIDKQTGMLVKTQSQQIVQGQWQTQTDSYRVPQGKAAAVLGTIPCLPLDVPLFSVTQDGSKALGDTEMVYEIVSGNNDNAKSLDEFGFTYKVKQSIKRVTPEGAKSLGNDAKTLGDDAVEVELQSGKQIIKQVWTSSSPWAVYSNNGTSEARLIKHEIPNQ